MATGTGGQPLILESTESDITMTKNGMTKNDLNRGCFLENGICVVMAGLATTILLKVEVSFKIQGLTDKHASSIKAGCCQARPAHTLVHARFVTWSTIHSIRTIRLCMFPS